MGGGASKSPKKSETNAPATAGNTEAKTDETSTAAAAPSAASEKTESKTDEPVTDAAVSVESKSSESKTSEESAPPSEDAAVSDESKSNESERDLPRSDSLKQVQSIGDIFEGEQRLFTEKEALSAGSAFGNIFQQKAKDGEVMQSHKALVFDCGTGETKAIFLKYHRSDDNQPIVEVQELNKAPATLDFLKRKNASDNEDYKAKLKVVDTGLDKKGRKAFATEEEREAARAKLNDGYWFLNEKPEGATDELLPQYFVDFCVQTKQKLIDSNQTPDTVMIGCSAWARNAGALQPEADALIIALSKAGLLCKKLLQSQEGAFEAAAVGYAYNAMMSAGPDDERAPTGLIGSGGGSVQFMNSMLYAINMDCGNRMCLEAMEDVYDDSSEEAGLASLEKCFAQSDSFKSNENVTTQKLHGRVHGEISEERTRTTAQFAGDEKAKQAINSPLGGSIICISACYYGALSIGRANVKDLDMNEYPCEQIIKEMRAKIEEDKQKLLDGTHADRKARLTLFKEIANLTLQTTLFEELFKPDAMLCFKRNWTLHKKFQFRTTWTAGWYLNFLYKMKIKFPGANAILEEYERTQRKAANLLEGAGARLDLDGFDDDQAQDVAMVLVDLKSVIKGMRTLALQIANPIDKFLKELADTYEGELVGWPHFKIKGNGSLYRKLIGTIFHLLEKNAEVPSYTPNVEDCVSSIHDSLRYTIVLPRDQYTKAVKDLEKRLLTGDNPRAKSIKFKNFWRENDGETTYQGINAQVCLNPVMDLATDENPVDDSPEKQEDEGFVYKIPTPTGKIIPNSTDFIFELQIHTHESYFMKDGPGHLLYEDFRDPAIRAGSVKGIEYDGTNDLDQYNRFKLALYRTNKELYRTKRDDGTPIQVGEVVCKGLKAVDKNHNWTSEDYTFVAYKPDPPIAFYNSPIPNAMWLNKLQVNSKIETQLTGLKHPHGYRVD